MDIGISTATLFTKLQTEEAVSLFEEWGISCCEVFFTSFSEYAPEFGDELVGRFRRCRPYSVHVLNTQFEPQLFNIHDRVKRDAFDWLGRVMRNARLIGAKRYTFHGIARFKRTFRENLPRTGEIMAEISRFCRGYGVELCCENVEWAFYNRPGVFCELKKYCPELYGVLDIKQARLSGYPYEEYLTEMGERISHVHVSDLDENGKMRLPGQGRFDFDELFRRLADVGFCGPLLIENYQNDFTDLAELRRSYEFLREKAERFLK